MIRHHFLSRILAPLQDDRAPMWEKRHALMALGCADAQMIAAHLDEVTPYLGSGEWWLRAAVFEALRPLIPETEAFRAALPAMLKSYDSDTNLPSRRWGATCLFKEAITQNPALKDEIVAGMARSVNRIELREGFARPVDENNIFETLRYIDMKNHPEHAIGLLPALEGVYPALEALDQAVERHEGQFGPVPVD